MRIKYFLVLLLTTVVTFSSIAQKKATKHTAKTKVVKVSNDFNYNVEQFADIKVLRYQIPGWENLTLKEQKLVYYLTQAGYSGRDITWDQNYRHNLTIRKALENVYTSYKGDKNTNR